MTNDRSNSSLNLENLVDSTLITTKDDSINLYANIDINCNEYDPIYSWQTIDTLVPIAITNSNKEYKFIAREFITTDNKHSLMDINREYISNECNAYKSLPNILLSSKSKQMSFIHSSKSLPSCFKYSQEQLQRISMSKNKIEKKKSNPTIGELLGDDDLFHYQYHNQYSSSRSKRKRYDRRSLPSHISVRHEQRSNYFKQSQHTPEASQVFLNPNCTPLPAYYYYSNMVSCCPCLISDPYVGLYPQGICYATSTSQHYYQSNEKYKYSDCYYQRKKDRDECSYLTR